MLYVAHEQYELQVYKTVGGVYVKNTKKIGR